ncbi:hypothetical protein E4U39_002611 [Claviceps sp. Clav50 group G5]|nr:hypothetical protein E4U39_002611 [Claviceps sp. Clav50 group G5]
MKFLSLIYIFGAFVSPIIANTVPNAEEVVVDTPGPSLRGAGHEVNEPGDPTTDFFRRRVTMAFRLFLLHRSRQKAPEMGQALGYVVR